MCIESFLKKGSPLILPTSLCQLLGRSSFKRAKSVYIYIYIYITKTFFKNLNQIQSQIDDIKGWGNFQQPKQLITTVVKIAYVQIK